MKSILAGTAMLALLTTTAMAQSSTNSQTQGTNNNPQGNSPTIANYQAAQKMKQDLTNAGFTDVKIVAESFVVQAKSKDGDPVLMTIGPHGMSVFEAMNKSGGSSTSSTTGSSAESQSSKMHK
jgi:opacity protein-like surface antigen